MSILLFNLLFTVNFTVKFYWLICYDSAAAATTRTTCSSTTRLAPPLCRMPRRASRCSLLFSPLLLCTPLRTDIQYEYGMPASMRCTSYLVLDEHAGGGGAGRTQSAVAPDHVGHLLGPATPPALWRHLSRPRRRRRDVLLHSHRARALFRSLLLICTYNTRIL